MLTWTDDRWHLEGRGIHAGESLEIRWPDGTWELVRVESASQGRRLLAYSEHHGQPFCVEIETERDQLRWPH